MKKWKNKLSCFRNKLSLAFKEFMKAFKERYFAICSHPDCDHGYESSDKNNPRFCGKHRYPLLSKCFFCGSRFEDENMDHYCLFCNANISESKFDVTCLFLIPVIFPERKNQDFHEFPKQFKDKLLNERKEFLPSLDWDSKLKEKLPNEFIEKLTSVEKDFGSFIDSFVNKYVDLSK
ncbi:hypothetical protein EHQ68_06820 [Leptospira congkakensis]|uniref:Uncharacterized protein n=1 Tax=Leptospira congkakensis TaxID=2484932 RepID=A0A4Z1A1Q4_9LEPT|nr:hypothetical protein [Leptospira congkakensis]TGL87675.1 hypothetical protein EHQ69_16340 [Leptospira congkakensis]TGL89709.1 hypothetical protein EHQ68_06820 [Leptospira congkakensis]TGL95825.1 hypothetical protein EHQ70_12010 [Leptospira congkakensis]